MVQHVPAVFTILRRRQVEAETGYSRSTIYLRMSEGLWPRPVRLGPRCVRWPASEVAETNAARIWGLGDDQIRALVRELEAARGAIARRSPRSA
jgi:prophage regulatory protein